VLYPVKLQQGRKPGQGAASAAAPAFTLRAGAAAKQQKAPVRCNPKGFVPAGGKPLHYLYVWSGAASSLQQKKCCRMHPICSEVYVQNLALDCICLSHCM
jgi:hypothetical protein